MASPEVALERLCSPEHEVSAHYLIGQLGQVWQLVSEEKRAWHAGAGQWQGRTDINSRSVGIELCNDGASPFPEPQMKALEAVLPAIMARWSIGPLGVIGHSDLAPMRKCDPGRRFDWARLARRGLAFSPTPAPQKDLACLADDLTRIGYDEDAAEAEVLAAFRHRTRPWARGPADATDGALARDWVEALSRSPLI